MAESMLQAIFEDEEVSGFVDSCSDLIQEAAGIFHETPQQIKDYIFENLQDFVVPGDIQTTYANMVQFVENCVVNNLTDLSNAIVDAATGE